MLWATGIDMRANPDHRAFEALLREHGGIVSKVARVDARDRQDIGDLRQGSRRATHCR
jgi:hypothetical protein